MVVELRQIRAVFSPSSITAQTSHHITCHVSNSRLEYIALSKGRRMTLIANSASAVLIQICMERILKGFPIKCFSSPFKTVLGVSIILVYFHLSSFIVERINCTIRPMINWQ